MTSALVLPLLLPLALAQATTSPSVPSDVPTVSAEDVKAWTSGAFDALLVDARPAAEYVDAHIPNAVNLPPERVIAGEPALPRSKATVLIFYCRGPG